MISTGNKKPIIVSKMSFIRPERKCSAELQKESNEATAGHDVEHFVVGEPGVTGWATVLYQHHEPRQSNRVDEIHVRLLRNLIDPVKHRGKGTLVAQIGVISKEIGRAGTVIVESGTGRRSDDPKQWKAMLEWLRVGMSKGHFFLPDEFAPGSGRRKTKVAPEVLDVCRPIWRNLKIENDEEALALFPHKMTRRIAVREFGPSGRKSGRKPMQKRRRTKKRKI